MDPTKHEQASAQLFLDLRTGRPTTIRRGIFAGSGLRAACSTLNRQRTRGIQALSRQITSRKSISIDVWTTLLAGNAAQWDVPLISLSALGIQTDPDGILYSTDLLRLGTGAEATAWLDEREDCVYKTFDLRYSGALGKKITLCASDEHAFHIVTEDATLDDTLEKLSVLHDIGTCHTEVIGLTDTGDYLLTKQPKCQNFVDFISDREFAVTAIRAVPCKGISARGWVFWHEDQAWCLGDLHKGNIMRNSKNIPTIIDALVGPIPPSILRGTALLKHTVERARFWSEQGMLLSDDPFLHVQDEDL